MAMPMNDAPSLPRALLPAGAAIALLGLALLLGHELRPLFNRPLQSLRVDGELTHLRPQQVAAAAAITPEMRLFDVDLNAMRARVEALPWVAHARVSRVWPGRIAVRVWERQPYARWGDKGLVDSEGVAYTPAAAELPQNLPLLSGPPGRESEVMRDYQQLVQALQGTAFAPAGLQLDARGDWTLNTASGIELRLGQNDPLQQAALLLGAVNHALADKLDQVAYVDLRYSNGFAVGWKEDAGACAEAKTSAPATARSGCSRKDAAPAINAAAKPAAAAAKAAKESKHE
jgi:cell division protein FtsQ